MKPSPSIWRLLTLLVLVLPTLYLLWAWPSLPAHIPSHFGIEYLRYEQSYATLDLCTSTVVQASVAQLE